MLGIRLSTTIIESAMLELSDYITIFFFVTPLVLGCVTMCTFLCNYMKLQSSFSFGLLLNALGPHTFYILYKVIKLLLLLFASRYISIPFLSRYISIPSCSM